jgi:hypothetical protein
MAKTQIIAESGMPQVVMEQGVNDSMERLDELIASSAFGR